MIEKHLINDIVWVEPFEGYAVIIGVTPQLDLVVRWYNDEGLSFKAVVAQSDCLMGKDYD
jgi:hypothetical protein